MEAGYLFFLCKYRSFQFHIILFFASLLFITPKNGVYVQNNNISIKKEKEQSKGPLCNLEAKLEIHENSFFGLVFSFNDYDKLKKSSMVVDYYSLELSI